MQNRIPIFASRLSRPASSFHQSFPGVGVFALIVATGAATLMGCSPSRTGTDQADKNSASASQAATVQPVTAEWLSKRMESGTAPVVVDVRTAEEFANGHVPGALNIPFDQMATRSGEVAAISGGKQTEVVLYCRSGRRSGIAAETLAGQGFSAIRLLEGDMPGWERSGLPVER